jgi:hypothetical protein
MDLHILQDGQIFLISQAPRTSQHIHIFVEGHQSICLLFLLAIVEDIFLL